MWIASELSGTGMILWNMQLYSRVELVKFQLFKSQIVLDVPKDSDTVESLTE